MDTELGRRLSLKLHGTDIAQRLMEALSVVEHLDEFKHRCVRLLARVEPWSCTSSFLSVLKKLSTTALS
jgi:hypothetical protein